MLRQIHDIGLAHHTHECGTRREATGIKHLRCYLCCWGRLPTSRVFAPEHRRSTSSVSSITLAVPSCSVASSPSDEERSVSLGFRTSATVDNASTCDGCCRVFDCRPWSLPKRAVSCPEAGQVGSRRTMWGATHLVCRLIFKPSSQDIAASRAWC